MKVELSIKSNKDNYPPTSGFRVEALMENGDVYASINDFADVEAAAFLATDIFYIDRYEFLGNETLGAKLEEAHADWAAGL